MGIYFEYLNEEEKTKDQLYIKKNNMVYLIKELYKKEQEQINKLKFCSKSSILEIEEQMQLEFDEYLKPFYPLAIACIYIALGKNSEAEEQLLRVKKLTSNLKPDLHGHIDVANALVNMYLEREKKSEKTSGINYHRWLNRGWQNPNDALNACTKKFSNTTTDILAEKANFNFIYNALRDFKTAYDNERFRKNNVCLLNIELSIDKKYFTLGNQSFYKSLAKLTAATDKYLKQFPLQDPRAKKVSCYYDDSLDLPLDRRFYNE